MGRTIKGRYRLERVVGEGGMGAVYAAEHVEIGRRVALKLVHAVHATNPQIVGRLKQEARAMSAIESENVVQVLDAGEDEEHGLFVVMELLEGEDLETKLQREKRLSPDEALRIADQAARGLARAHARGIIHRDLKPANVFLCTREDGEPLVKLVDFGIAKLVRDAALAPQTASNFTMGGCVVGTPQYMSPEQAQGLASIDGRTDVYSLGALLYEMLVGEPPVPYLENYEQKILHIVTQPRPRVSASLPWVNPALDQLIADMMAFDPSQRPQTMGALRERIAPLRSRAAISEPPPPPRTTDFVSLFSDLANTALATVRESIAPLYARAAISEPPPPPRTTPLFSVPPPPPMSLPPVDAVDPVTIPFMYRTDARRLAWGAAAITVLAIVIGTVRASAGPPPHPIARSATRTAVVVSASGLETTSAVRVRAAAVPPPAPPAPPVVRWVPPPAPPPVSKPTASRPLGGTGITQEF